MVHRVGTTNYGGGRLTRRQFLRTTAGLAVALFLPGCETAPLTPASQPAPAAPVATERYTKEAPWHLGRSTRGDTTPWMVMFSAHVEYGVQEKYGGRFAGYSCIAANWDANKQIEDIRRLLREGVDLLLIDPLDTSVVATGIGEAMDAGVPVILACTRAGTSPYVGWVRLNEEARGKACADWLQHTGSGGQVVVLASAPAHDNAELWLQAVSQGLEEQPGVQGATVARCGWSWAAARVAMGRLLDSGTPVDALAVNCGVVGKGAVEAFLERGRPIPPVAGADDWNGWLRQASRTGVRFLGFTGGANLGLRCVEQAVKVLSGEPVLPYEEFPWQTFDENGLGGYYRPELSDHYWAVHDLPPAWIDRMFRPQ